MKERYLQNPDYEERCNSFLKDVNENIIPKYSNLVIDAKNATTELVDKEMERLETISSSKLSKYFKDKFSEVIRQTANDADIHSAFFNMASIAIWGWETDTQGDIAKAAEEILKSSEKYKPNDCQINSMECDELPYCAYMTAIFS